MSDAVLVDAFAAIEVARGDVTLTYFEFGILAALLTFKQAAVDVTVLEVGLGGRLDAVNLVDASVSVITSIGIDHVAYLGPDRETIAAEKAGILRAGVPCIYGEPSMPRSIAQAAAKLAAPLLHYGVDFDAQQLDAGWRFNGRRGGTVCSVANLRQPRVALRNAATALQALLVFDADAPVLDVVADAAQAHLPGRFEHFDYRGVPVIVDVAHNPHGGEFLARQLIDEGFTGTTIGIAGFLQDKDAAGIVAALDAVVDEWVFVDTTGPRGQDGTTSARKAGTECPASVGVSLRDALDRYTMTSGGPLRVVVLGSFDVAQRARDLLGCQAGPAEVQHAG